jgi:hypothetical protein
MDLDRGLTHVGGALSLRTPGLKMPTITTPTKKPRLLKMPSIAPLAKKIVQPAKQVITRVEAAMPHMPLPSPAKLDLAAPAKQILAEAKKAKPTLAQVRGDIVTGVGHIANLTGLDKAVANVQHHPVTQHFANAASSIAKGTNMLVKNITGAKVGGGRKKKSQRHRRRRNTRKSRKTHKRRRR